MSNNNSLCYTIFEFQFSHTWALIWQWQKLILVIIDDGDIRSVYSHEYVKMKWQCPFQTGLTFHVSTETPFLIKNIIAYIIMINTISHLDMHVKKWILLTETRFVFCCFFFRSLADLFLNLFLFFSRWQL